MAHQSMLVSAEAFFTAENAETTVCVFRLWVASHGGTAISLDFARDGELVEPLAVSSRAGSPYAA
jgi:hypothetical protein